MPPCCALFVLASLPLALNAAPNATPSVASARAAAFALADAPSVSRATTLPATLPDEAATQPVRSSAPWQNLVAHGSDTMFWYAQVVMSSGPQPTVDKSYIRFRTAGSDDWLPLLTLDHSRVIDLANSGSRLAVLLDDGTWLFASESNSATQPRLPAPARMLALANDGDTLWAAGGTSVAPATQPFPVATSATRPQTAPGTAPAVAVNGPPMQRVALYWLKGDGWAPATLPPLPVDVPVDAPVSLAIIEHVPWVAVRVSDDTIRVWRQSGAPASWQAAGEFGAPTERRAFKLLAGRSPASLWIADTLNDRLEVLEPLGGGEVMPLEKTRAPVVDRTAANACHAVRELTLTNGNLLDHPYGEAKMEPLPPQPIPNPESPTPPYYRLGFQIILTVALAFAIFASSRRGRDPKDIDEATEGLILAELWRRAIAGVVDLFPFAVPIAMFIQWFHAGAPLASQDQAHVNIVEMTAIAAMLIYLIITAASEALAGRTIGKILLGLRVVRTDGGTPDSSALLIRNFLRVVDLGLLGIPLVFVPFSPLRQRIGDVAAGTVVIRDRVRPEGNLIEPPQEETPVVAKPAESAGD